MKEAIKGFIRNKDRIFNLLDSENYLSDSEKKRLRAFINSFYDKIENNIIIVR